MRAAVATIRSQCLAPDGKLREDVPLCREADVLARAYGESLGWSAEAEALCGVGAP
jgi:hypothetical protein